MERPSNPDDYTRHIDQSIDNLDNYKVDELHFMRYHLNRKDDDQRREVDRLRRKYGNDHPELKKLQARLKYNEAFLPALDEHINNVSTKPESLPANAWRVHGEVTAKLQPVEGINLFLVNEKLEPLRELPNSCSNEEGLYSITLSKAQIDALQKSRLLLAIISANEKKPFPVNDLPLTPIPNAIDRMDVELPAEQCSPPYPDQDDRVTVEE